MVAAAKTTVTASWYADIWRQGNPNGTQGQDVEIWVRVWMKGEREREREREGDRDR